jgi:oligopeptide/dipeptide ABC transporter ATP-binding protein
MTAGQDRPQVPLLSVRGLRKVYPRKDGGTVTAVDGLDFDLFPGETMGIVGESGCGKSTAARAILHLAPPTSGTVIFDGHDLGTLDASAMRRLRRHMQMIFQDPIASLSPRMRVGEIIAEPMLVHGMGTAASRRDRVDELMRMVGLDPRVATRAPHQFSGGQAQRVGIARALATSPKLIVADEAISALDVSVQAQVVNLLIDLRDRLDLTFLFISHNLAMMRYISNRLAVMYLGQFVEIGPSADVFRAPLHPYTRALIDAIPVADPARARSRSRAVPAGELPSPDAPPSGCRYNTRCPHRTEICSCEIPKLRSVTRGGHARRVACHHAEILPETAQEDAPAATGRPKARQT